jgi:hypothetical protein
MKIGQAIWKVRTQTNYVFKLSVAVYYTHFAQTAAAGPRRKHQTVFLLFWSSREELKKQLQQQKFIR